MASQSPRGILRWQVIFEERGVANDGVVGCGWFPQLCIADMKFYLVLEGVVVVVFDGLLDGLGMYVYACERCIGVFLGEHETEQPGASADIEHMGVLGQLNHRTEQTSIGGYGKRHIILCDGELLHREGLSRFVHWTGKISVRTSSLGF